LVKIAYQICNGTVYLGTVKVFSKVAADTGDFELIEKFMPLNATTNPSLILKTAQQTQSAHLVEQGRAIAQSKEIAVALDHLVVLLGLEILKFLGGKVCTEVDARLSFDVGRTIEKAKDIIILYEANGITRDMVLIKIVATWEEICASKALGKRDSLQFNAAVFQSTSNCVCGNECNANFIFYGKNFGLV